MQAADASQPDNAAEKEVIQDTNDATHEDTDAAASAPNPGGKLFVGGLNWDTTAESMRAALAEYGAIDNCIILQDKHTGQPRGFGFVTFTDPAVAQQLARKRHVDVDGRQVELKLATPKGDPVHRGRDNRPAATALPSDFRTNKIFVGGLPWGVTQDIFRSHFEAYGTVVHAQIMLTREGKPRGFGYVTFAEEEDVAAAVADGVSHELCGRVVDVKKAIPKELMPSSKGRRENNNHRNDMGRRLHNDMTMAGLDPAMANLNLSWGGLQFPPEGAGFDSAMPVSWPPEWNVNVPAMMFQMRPGPGIGGAVPGVDPGAWLPGNDGSMQPPMQPMQPWGANPAAYPMQAPPLEPVGGGFLPDGQGLPGPGVDQPVQPPVDGQH